MPVSPVTSITDLINGAAGLVVVLSGLLAATARSVATLAGFSSEQIEQITAVGFLVGATVAILLLTFDPIAR